jgi:hypothetical protein
MNIGNFALTHSLKVERGSTAPRSINLGILNWVISLMQWRLWPGQTGPRGPLNRGIVVRLPAGTRDTFFSFRNGPERIWGPPRILDKGIKKPGSVAKVKNEWSYTPTPTKPPLRSQGQLAYPLKSRWEGPEAGLDAFGEVKTCFHWRKLNPDFLISSSLGFSFFHPPPLPPWCCGPSRAMASSLLRFLDHTQRCTTDLYLTTRNTHNIHPFFRGIRTYNPNRRAAADPRLIPRGHWDWRIV